MSVKVFPRLRWQQFCFVIKHLRPGLLAGWSTKINFLTLSASFFSLENRIVGVVPISPTRGYGED